MGLGSIFKNITQVKAVEPLTRVFNQEVFDREEMPFQMGKVFANSIKIFLPQGLRQGCTVSASQNPLDIRV